MVVDIDYAGNRCEALGVNYLTGVEPATLAFNDRGYPIAPDPHGTGIRWSTGTVDD